MDGKSELNAFLALLLPKLDDRFAWSIGDGEDLRRGVEAAVREAFANCVRLRQVIEAPAPSGNDSEREKAIHALKEA